MEFLNGMKFSKVMYLNTFDMSKCGSDIYKCTDTDLLKETWGYTLPNPPAALLTHITNALSLRSARMRHKLGLTTDSYCEQLSGFHVKWMFSLMFNAKWSYPASRCSRKPVTLWKEWVFFRDEATGELTCKLMKALTLKPSILSMIVYSVLQCSTLCHTLSQATAGNIIMKTRNSEPSVAVLECRLVKENMNET